MENKESWHGVDRTLIDWHPAIDLGKCTGCGMCLLTCGNDVFRMSKALNRPLVQNPGKCVIGCTTCGKLCPESAISFPSDPKQFVKGLILKYKIYPKVKEDLKARIEKFPDHSVHIEAGKNDK